MNNPQRGFSVLANGPLDMRMDPRVLATINLPFKDILSTTIPRLFLKCKYIIYCFTGMVCLNLNLFKLKVANINQYHPL